MKIPRPNEFIWATTSHTHRDEDFFNLKLIRAEFVYFVEDAQEWAVLHRGIEYYAADCMPTEETIFEEEILGIFD